MNTNRSFTDRIEWDLQDRGCRLDWDTDMAIDAICRYQDELRDQIDALEKQMAESKAKIEELEKRMNPSYRSTK